MSSSDIVPKKSSVTADNADQRLSTGTKRAASVFNYEPTNSTFGKQNTGATPREDITKVGSDGKPMCFLVGTLSANVNVDIFVKRKNTDYVVKIPALHFYVENVDWKMLGRPRNVFSPGEINFHPQFIKSDLDSTKIHLGELLSADCMPRSHAKATIQEQGGKSFTIREPEIVLTSIAIQDLESDAEYEPQPRKRQRGGENLHHQGGFRPSTAPKQSYRPIPPPAENHSPSSARKVATELFAKSMDLIERSFKDKIQEHEKHIVNLQEAAKLDNTKIVSLEEQIKNLEIELAKAKSTPKNQDHYNQSIFQPTQQAYASQSGGKKIQDNWWKGLRGFGGRQSRLSSKCGWKASDSRWCCLSGLHTSSGGEWLSIWGSF